MRDDLWSFVPMLKCKFPPHCVAKRRLATRARIEVELGGHKFLDFAVRRHETARMDLKEFVRETLVQIIDGVGQAQVQRRGLVNPELREIQTESGMQIDQENIKGSGLLLSKFGSAVIQIVEFDIAITVSNQGKDTTGSATEKEAGVKLQVVSASIGESKSGTYEMQRSRTDISHIKFRVPIMFDGGI